MSSRIDEIEKRNQAIGRFLEDASMYSERVARETIEAQRQDIGYLLLQLKEGGAGGLISRKEVIDRIERQIRLWNDDTVTMACADMLAELKTLNATAPTETGAHVCRPCGYHAAVCCQCRRLLPSGTSTETSARCGEAWRIVREIAKTTCYHKDSDRIGAPKRCAAENWWCLSCRAKDLIDSLPVTPLPNSEEFKTIGGEVLSIPFGTREPTWIAACAIHEALERGDIRDIIAPEQFQEIILRNLSKCVFPASTEQTNEQEKANL